MFKSSGPKGHHAGGAIHAAKSHGETGHKAPSSQKGRAAHAKKSVGNQALKGLTGSKGSKTSLPLPQSKPFETPQEKLAPPSTAAWWSPIQGLRNAIQASQTGQLSREVAGLGGAIE